MRATTAAAVSLLCLVLVQPAAATSVDAQRASSSYTALKRYLFGFPAEAWPLSQELAASIAVRSPAGEQLALQELQSMRSGPLYRSAPGSGDVYYDDNEWIAEDLLDLRGRGAVSRARAILAGVVDAWDGDSTHPCAGGVYWTSASGILDRNTVTTANGALVSLRLYALTYDPALLYWARRMLDWLDACMLEGDGLYADHIGGDGTVDPSEWSYNQGAVLGAYLELYETTGQAAALARAGQIADAALAHFASRWLTCEPPEFAAIFFRRLLELAAVDKRQSYVAAAEAYGARAWNTLRNPQTGLFNFPGSDPLLVQASFVQLYAALMGMTTGG